MKKLALVIIILLSIPVIPAFCAGMDYTRPASEAFLRANFDNYMADVNERLQKNWNPPDVLDEGTVRVLFKISNDGKILSKRILESSGNELFDESALEAVRKSAPFEKFPPESTREFIIINYLFHSTLVKTDKMKEYLELSDSYFTRDKNESLRYLNLAMEEASGDKRTYFLYEKRAKIKDSIGDKEGAKADWEKFNQLKAAADIERVNRVKKLAESDGSAFAYYYLTHAYEQIRDYNKAIESIDKAISLTDLNNQYKRYRSELVKKQTNTEF